MKPSDRNPFDRRRTVILTAVLLAIALLTAGCAVTAGTQNAEIPADDVSFEEPTTP
jgi:hypothetical protein